MPRRVPELLWEPTPALVESSGITDYMRWLQQERGLSFAAYEDLWAWSVADIEAFWASLWDYFDIIASKPYDRVLGRRTMPGAEWFPGAELSYAEHIFRNREPGTVAVVHASELRPLAETTWGALAELTAAIAGGLRELGVERGDRVVAYMPNILETTAAFFACASIGAIWASCSPDFGSRSAVDRFAQIEPKVLIGVDGYRYGGKSFDRRATLAAFQQEIPTLEHIVVLPFLDGSPDLSMLTEPLLWDDLLRPGTALTFEQLPFDHPLWVVYSSGTTGLPKAIVHGQGGILLEHLKKARLHFDLRPGERFFWFSTTGWMMWNLLLGGLLTDAPVVLYDGSPGYPDMNVLWDLVDEAQIGCLGVSAAYINACMKADVHPREGRDLSSLRSIGSTGSPLSPEGFRWVYDEVGEDIWLFSTSGGTDVATAFVGGVPTLPVYLGELQARSLGADIQSWDEAGSSLVDEMGELVIPQPMPSMPVSFWGDKDGSRMRESYFETYDGVWRHGDWIEITSRGTAVIFGRSDSTINRGGIRMGTAEIYASVLALDEVVDALVVDVPRTGAESWMPLFVVLAPGATLDDALVKKIRDRIRVDCSPRHVPDEIREIAEVPRTLSGKVLEVPVKRILMGQSADAVASRDSLASPAALDYFTTLAAELSRG